MHSKVQIMCNHACVHTVTTNNVISRSARVLMNDDRTDSI